MRLFALIGILLSITGVLRGAAEGPATLSLSQRDPDHPEIVTIRLRNHSDHDIYWLDWWMPVDGKVRNGLLEIKEPLGKEAKYLGIWASYGEPKRSDYVLLKAGASEEMTVNLTLTYDLQRDTDYDAVIDRALEYYNSTDATEPEKWALLKSNRLRLRLESTFWQKIRRWWNKDA